MFIISYATPEYELEAYKLLEDIRKLNLPHEVHFMPGEHDWYKNNHLKAEFIKEMLLKHKRPVVWLDADTEIRHYPDLFGQLEQEPRTSDIAVNYFKGQQLCGGVMFFDYNTQVISLLEAWIAENKAHPLIWESENLNNLLANRPLLKVFKLPREYCTFDLCEDQSNAVLWSRQASRRLAQTVK